ncbi:MAG: imidazole glycerol phosphate synthase subunit HisH [Pyrinomonadaceae bacterium]
MPLKLTVVDYGMGNLNSVKKILERMNVETIISSDPKDIFDCDKLILPGVGHFGRAMSNLKTLNIADALNEVVLVKKKPILGICLGMQLLAKKSEEGNSEGLGWIDAEVVKFNVSDKLKYKVPHMGWNQISIKKQSLLMKNISESAEFYFVHSYHLIANNNSNLLNETNYEYSFTSAVEKDNIFGVQYHPEKSHDTGAQLIKNFIEL